MKVGDVIACPEWHHSDLCKAPGCQNEDERNHVGCEFCGGSKRVRVVEVTDGARIVESAA